MQQVLLSTHCTQKAVPHEKQSAGNIKSSWLSKSLQTLTIQKSSHILFPMATKKTNTYTRVYYMRTHTHVHTHKLVGG